MKYIELTSTDPYSNLAAEEYVFEQMDKRETYFMLWQNHNSIIVGKHQNTLEEINQPFVKARRIRVARRLTGGGAVYHDAGNLNFTFIADQGDAADFRVFALPILQAVRQLGIDAEFSGRNDLTIEGRKFSGNSQYVRNGRVLAHGCVLLDANIDYLEKALTVQKEKYRSRGVKSVASRVTCINDHLENKITMDEFKRLVREQAFACQSMERYEWTDEDKAAIGRLCREKYASWNWNYGESPRCTVKCEKKFPAGLVAAYVEVNRGCIKQIRFYGDFFGSEELTVLEEKMAGLALDESLGNRLETLDIPKYMNGITSRDIEGLLLS